MGKTFQIELRPSRGRAGHWLVASWVPKGVSSRRWQSTRRRADAGSEPPRRRGLSSAWLALPLALLALTIVAPIARVRGRSLEKPAGRAGLPRLPAHEAVDPARGVDLDVELEAVVGALEPRRDIGSSAGRCVSSRRFASAPTAAATASSAERWPRGVPSASPVEASPRRRTGRRRGRARASRSLGPQSPEYASDEPLARQPESRTSRACSGGGGSAVSSKPATSNRVLGLVLVHREDPVEHVGEAEALAERSSTRVAARVHPELGRCPTPFSSLRRNMAPQTHGMRSPQWSRWKCVIAIASTRGHASRSRRRGSTPGPQSSNRRRPPASTR